MRSTFILNSPPLLPGERKTTATACIVQALAAVSNLSDESDKSDLSDDHPRHLTPDTRGDSSPLRSTLHP